MHYVVYSRRQCFNMPLRILRCGLCLLALTITIKNVLMEINFPVTCSVAKQSRRTRQYQEQSQVRTFAGRQLRKEKIAECEIALFSRNLEKHHSLSLDWLQNHYISSVLVIVFRLATQIQYFLSFFRCIVSSPAT